MQRGKGKLSFEDGELAAQDFWALILSAPRNLALHVPDQIPQRPHIRRYLENGLKVFIKAYATDVTKNLGELAGAIQKREGGNSERETDR